VRRSSWGSELLGAGADRAFGIGLARAPGRQADDLAAYHPVVRPERLAKLDEDERVRFDFLLLGVLRVFETLYLQSKHGTGDPASSSEEMNTMVSLGSGRPAGGAHPEP
jgi:hypothetical protein